MNKAIFLDRDGVINIERGTYTYKIDDFVFVEGIFNNLKKLQDNGFQLIIITNQGGIANNIYTKKDLETLHDFMLGEFKKNKIHITEIYFCPHHSDLENCICRKPNSLMIEKALNRFQIDPQRSFIIGDKTRDMRSGERLGIKGFKVTENQNISDIVNKILNND